MTDISIVPADTIPLTITINLPKKVVLPIQFSPDGDAYPSAGISLTRVFNAPDLLAGGIEVSWQFADGSELPKDEALALIERHTQEAIANQPVIDESQVNEQAA